MLAAVVDVYNRASGPAAYRVDRDGPAFVLRPEWVRTATGGRPHVSFLYAEITLPPRGVAQELWQQLVVELSRVTGLEVTDAGEGFTMTDQRRCNTRGCRVATLRPSPAPAWQLMDDIMAGSDHEASWFAGGQGGTVWVAWDVARSEAYLRYDR